MRVFSAFLVIMTTCILLMLPVTEAIYDFRTDVREDSFSVTTGAVTSANVTLVKEVYDDDTSTIELTSDNTSDSPTFSSYDTATRGLTVSGLSADTTRDLTVAYDVYALTGWDAIDTLLSRFDLIWLICIFSFGPAALAAIFLGRA